MQTPAPSQSPFQSLPIAPVALALIILAIEAVFQLGAAGIIGGPGALGWRIEAITRLGVSAPLVEYMIVSRQVEWDGLIRFVAYPFVHHGPVHAALGAVLVLALGKAVSERFSSISLVAMLVIGALAGAVAYALIFEGRVLLVGVYPAVYGLIGGYTWALWRAGEGRQRWLAFRLIAVLLGLQLAFRLTIGGGADWIADLAGFVAGFGAAFLLAPDGSGRLRNWLNRARNRPF